MTHTSEDPEFRRAITQRGGRRRLTDEERRAAVQKRHPKAVAMLRDGATHHQVADACGISTATVSNIRRALGIPAPGQRPGPKNPRTGQSKAQRRLDDDVARLLAAGHTYEQIRHTLHVGTARITRILHDRGIVLAPGRGKRSPADRAAAVEQALLMLREGASYRNIRAATGIDPNTVSALRKQHSIPVPERAPAPHARKQARTIAEVLTLHTQPYGDGHARWTGPRSGNQDILCAEGRRHSARRNAFRAHHQREPTGPVTPSCTEPHCIAGPHLTDDLIRTAHTRADQAFEQIFGDTP